MPCSILGIIFVSLYISLSVCRFFYSFLPRRGLRGPQIGLAGLHREMRMYKFIEITLIVLPRATAMHGFTYRQKDGPELTPATYLLPLHLNNKRKAKFSLYKDIWFICKKKQ